MRRLRERRGRGRAPSEGRRKPKQLLLQHFTYNRAPATRRCHAKCRCSGLITFRRVLRERRQRGSVGRCRGGAEEEKIKRHADDSRLRRGSLWSSGVWVEGWGRWGVGGYNPAEDVSTSPFCANWHDRRCILSVPRRPAGPRSHSSSESFMFTLHPAKLRV